MLSWLTAANRAGKQPRRTPELHAFDAPQLLTHARKTHQFPEPMMQTFFGAAIAMRWRVVLSWIRRRLGLGLLCNEAALLFYWSDGGGGGGGGGRWGGEAALRGRLLNHGPTDHSSIHDWQVKQAPNGTKVSPESLDMYRHGAVTKLNRMK